MSDTDNSEFAQLSESGQFNYSPDTSRLLCGTGANSINSVEFATQNVSSHANIYFMTNHDTTIPNIDVSNVSAYLEPQQPQQNFHSQPPPHDNNIIQYTNNAPTPIYPASYLANVPSQYQIYEKVLNVNPTFEAMINQSGFILNAPPHPSLGNNPVMIENPNQMDSQQYPYAIQMPNNPAMIYSQTPQNLNELAMQHHPYAASPNAIIIQQPPQQQQNVAQNFNAPVRGNDVSSNIYVNKASAKLSEAEDWTPNPLRLLDILSELDKLNEVINRLKDECDMSNAKPSVKRERNRLASKACRLKKKAAHETNKIKLEGLEMEFKLLILSLHTMSWDIINYLSATTPPPDKLAPRLLELQKKYIGSVKVAGDSDTFVKGVLERCRMAASVAANPHVNFNITYPTT